MDNKRRLTILAHGTLLNVMCQPEWEGGLGRMDTHTCMAESLGCSAENGIILLIGYAPIQNAFVFKKKKKGKKSHVVMDSTRIYHTKGSQKKKDKYHMVSLICGI